MKNLDSHKLQLRNDPWLTVYEWLKKCGVRLDKNYCKEEITTHPDYPALLSTVDFLSLGNLDFHAVRAKKSDINLFNYPLLAHIINPVSPEIKQPGLQYMQLISTVEDWDKQVESTQYWSGVTLFPGKTPKWHHEEQEKKWKSVIRNKLVISILTITAAILVVSTSFRHSDIVRTLFGLSSLVGLFLSIVTLSVELGIQNQLVKQFCGAISSSGCDGVLKSHYAKGVLGITPADVSILYFAVQFGLFLTSGWSQTLYVLLANLTLGGLVVSMLSIYTQAVKIKQWCSLCLAIVATLIVQFLFALKTVSITSRDLPWNIGLYFLTTLIITLIYILIKQLLITNYTNRIKAAELRKWKMDAELFEIQHQREPHSIDPILWTNDLILGNSKAPLLITVACNPYCTPCAKTHQELITMLEKFPDKIAIAIRFLTPPKLGKDATSKVVSAILQASLEFKDNDQLSNCLADWFEMMDFEKWSAKWKPNLNFDVSSRLLQHNEWIKSSKIEFTPTLFLNGKKIPGHYNINDLDRIIPQLAANIEEIEFV